MIMSISHETGRDRGVIYYDQKYTCLLYLCDLFYMKENLSDLLKAETE